MIVDNSSDGVHKEGGDADGFVNVGTDILRPYLLVEAGLNQHPAHLLVYPGEHQVDSFRMGEAQQTLQVVQPGGIHKGNFAHPNDTDSGLVAHPVHHVVKLIGHAKKEGAIYFVHLYALGEDE